eukprot:snap_masked-scaffold_3-processed-gene-10.42-mRNA-1 protein AED:1.00 eAED:1.00 QI:0/0/0/0/1/1/2/0/105
MFILDEPDEGDEDEEKQVSVGGEFQSDMETEKKRVKEYIEKGFDENQIEVIKTILGRKINAFGTEHEQGRMSLLTGMECTLKQNAPGLLRVKPAEIGATKKAWLR